MPRQNIWKLHEASISNDFSSYVKEFSNSSEDDDGVPVQGY